MQLHQASLLNRLAKKMAAPLSRIVSSPRLLSASRGTNAYLNFLLGQGSGAGWDLAHEVDAAVLCVRSEKPVIFDVGANVGNWSAGVLAKLPAAQIYLFEPSPTCQREIKKRHFANAKLIPCAVGDSRRSQNLHFSSDLDETASLHERKDSYFAARDYQQIEVSVVTVDDVMTDEGIAFLDLLKLDIEGHELFALHGAAKAIRARKIGAILFEFGSGNINSRTYFKDFWDLLTKSGFSITRITPGGVCVPILTYYEDLEYFRGVSNYLAEQRRPLANAINELVK